MAKNKVTDDNDGMDPELQEILAQAPAPAQALPPASPSSPITQGQFSDLIGALVAGLKGVSLSPESLKDILTEVGKTNAEIARKARWPENAEHPNISVYFSEADLAQYGHITNKPKLARKTYFCGIEEKEDRLTVAEVLGYNAISKPYEVRGGSWRAEIRKPQAMGAMEELYIWVPKETVDQRMLLPTLPLILHELNGGPSTADVMELLKQISDLKNMLADAKGKTIADLEAELLAK